jgi:isocitrate dehydrogenase (NAD+)
MLARTFGGKLSQASSLFKTSTRFMSTFDEIPTKVVLNKDFVKDENGDYIVTLLKGDGIGPEISESVKRIFEAAKAPISWEEHEVYNKAMNNEGDLLSDATIDSIRKNKVALKGPFMTPIGKGFRSLNVTLRKKLQLYANVRPCRTIKGIDNIYEKVDVVTIRENTEGEYMGLEHRVIPGVSESIKIVSRRACLKIARYAFEYAINNNRKRVVGVHKAGVMKMGDGLFLKCLREIAQEYPEIEYSETQVDTMCMKLAMQPEDCDIMCMPNLYGDIVSDLCAGLIGGLGLTASGNIGADAAVFEAVHGTAPDIAGKNLANPTALSLSACMMLDHMELYDDGSKIRKAIFDTIEARDNLTRDLKGAGSTSQFTDAVIKRIEIANKETKKSYSNARTNKAEQEDKKDKEEKKSDAKDEKSDSKDEKKDAKDEKK